MSSHKNTIAHLVTVLILMLGSPIHSGFTDPLNTQNVDHMITSLQTPEILDNTTLAVNKGSRQSIFPGAFPPALASLGSFGSLGGLRTVMMGGMLYGLSLIPAIMLSLSGNGVALGGLLSSMGLSKRTFPETSSAKMPLLTESQTKRLLQMLQSAFKQWNVADEHCKQLFVCQMYRQVSNNGVTPDLELFKEALLHILERGGQRRAGKAAEHLLAEYEHYFAAARMGLKQENCEGHYTKCSLSLYPSNDGFKSERNTALTKKKVQELPKIDSLDNPIRKISN
ncbi:hypothetical protein HNY73_007983 [Argiope bruennichi]|uniref:Uncharacterized protein n=1 Tax=Argiope bruennichi TaxID=94029 RepID=A0A8T0FA44_ARGBR|nr:hypothetical protein HNY73_007983 [Argiope bruennichi]